CFHSGMSCPLSVVSGSNRQLTADSFTAQSDERVHARGSPRWNITGQQGDTNQQRTSNDERQRVIYAHAVNHSFVLALHQVERAAEQTAKHERGGKAKT